MKNKTLEPKTEARTGLSPYQAERAEAQEIPVLRPGALGGTLAPPGSEATLRAHAAGLDRATAGQTLRGLQRQYGNRYVQRVVELAPRTSAGLTQRWGSGEGASTSLSTGFTLDDETAGRINRARGGGQPLDGAVQARMSQTLGHDFSGVRVHTDREAHTLNRLLSARAFTTGQDIFFRQGEYNPGSGPGRELIGHELSHVVQQGTGRVSGGGSGMTVRPAGDAFEQEADTQASQAARANRKANTEVVTEVLQQQGEEAGLTYTEPPVAIVSPVVQCNNGDGPGFGDLLKIWKGKEAPRIPVYELKTRLPEEYKREQRESKLAKMIMAQAVTQATRPGGKSIEEYMKGYGWSAEDVQKHITRRDPAFVKYFESDAARGEYEVIGGAPLKQGNLPGSFDTRNMASLQGAGRGYGIYVMSPDNRFYSGSHKVGLFHHSSFLAGMPVAGAGEWKVTNGKLEEITNKSGHYRPGPVQMINTLKELRRRGTKLGTVKLVIRGDGAGAFPSAGSWLTTKEQSL
jgi:hypothetical protein